MSKLLKVTVLALLFAVIWGAAGEVQATVKVGARYLPKFVPLSYVKGTGEVKLKITIQRDLDDPQAPWDEVTLTAYGVDLKYRGDTTRWDNPYSGFSDSKSLEYYGDSTWLARFDQQGHYSTTFDLTVPDNDTSCFVILLEFDGYSFYQGQCFVTTGDTLNIFRAWSNYWGDLQLERSNRRNPVPREEHERAKREWEERQEQLRRFKGKSTRGHGPRLSPEDSVIFNTLSEKGERRFVRMRNLERTPLTDESRQVISLDGTVYVRYRGEAKFHIVEGTTDPIAHAKQVMDSVRIAENKDYDITIDLRDSDDSEFVKNLVDTLMPTEQQGFFRAVVKWQTIMQLRDNAIEFYPTDRGSREPQDNSEPQQPEEKKESSGKSRSTRQTEEKSPQEIIFSEGFEGAFPGIMWSVEDLDPTDGYDYWDDVTCRPSSGAWSVWCSGGGNMPECLYYDYNMDTYMSMNYGIELSDYINVYVSYSIWYDMEPDFDYVAEYYSEDGQNWYLGDYYYGNSGGWWDIWFPYDMDRYYMKFVFFSYVYATSEDGVFIDDIEITGDPAPKPNLTWSWPPGWDWPIVPSADSGTNTVSTLYGGEPVYIDWSMFNDGETDAEFFHVGLYLDDVLLHEWYFDLLEPWDWHDEEDYQTTISTGYHTLKVWVDNRTEVDESNEGDNTYEKGFWWEEPEITYTGHVKYWDMTPPAANERWAPPIRIELRDKDGSGSQLLDFDITGYNGYFQLGPVTNNNDTQDKDPGVQQDIFFKIISNSNPADVVNWDGDHYSHTTPETYNHPSGDFDTTILIPTDSSGAFFVVEVITEGRDTCDNHVVYVPHTLVILDRTLSHCGTCWQPSNQQLLIDTTTFGYHPETWDRDVILHEYGHRVADFHTFFNSLLGVGTHYWESKYDPYFASSEGWASFFAAWVTRDPMLVDYDAGFFNYLHWNCENGEWGENSVVSGSANNYGDSCEGAVAGILWDIFDNVNDDYSTFGYFPTSPPFDSSDGIGDSLSDGIGNILIALKDRYVNGHHPDNIDEFWQAWFTHPTFGHLKAMIDIWYEHGEIMHCCNHDGIRGDVDYSGGGPNVGDVAYLVGYLFDQPPGPAPPCFEESDLDDTGGLINVGDLAYLVSYLFDQPHGPPPPACP